MSMLDRCLHGTWVIFEHFLWKVLENVMPSSKMSEIGSLETEILAKWPKWSILTFFYLLRKLKERERGVKSKPTYSIV